MLEEKFAEKILKESDVDSLTRNQYNDIVSLVKDVNNGRLNKNFLNNKASNLLVPQINCGIDDIYERFYKIKNNLKKRDQSLDAFILKFGSYYGKKLFDEQFEKCKNDLDGFIKRYGEKEGRKKYEEFKFNVGRSLESFVKKYGDEEGKRKYKEYWDNTNFSNSLDAYIRRHGEEEGREKYKKDHERMGYNRTLEGLKEKYGDYEGELKYYEFLEKRNAPKRKENFIQKLIDFGYSEEEILEKINERWNNTSKEAFIKKYGENEGIKRYEEYVEKHKENNPISTNYYLKQGYSFDESCYFVHEEQKKRIKNMRIGRNVASKESLKNCEKVIKELEHILNEKCLYDDQEHIMPLNETEQKYIDKNYYAFDFTFKESKIIVEYHGERYHDDIDYTLSNMLSWDKDKLEKESDDLIKKFFAEERGYNVIIIRSWNVKNDLLSLSNFIKERYSQEISKNVLLG